MHIFATHKQQQRLQVFIAVVPFLVDKMNKIALVAMTVLALAAMAAAWTAPAPPAGWDDWATFDWEAQGTYKAVGYSSTKPGPGPASPTDEARFIIDVDNEIMHFDMGAGGGKGWITKNGTYNLSPVAQGSTQMMCLATGGTYADQIAHYAAQAYHKATFRNSYGSVTKVYQGAVNDTSSCTRPLAVHLTTDGVGHITSFGVTYQLCPAPGQPLVMEQAMQFTGFVHGPQIAGQIPPVDPLCFPPYVQNYCDLFYVHQCNF